MRLHTLCSWPVSPLPCFGSKGAGKRIEKGGMKIQHFGSISPNFWTLFNLSTLFLPPFPIPPSLEDDTGVTWWGPANFCPIRGEEMLKQIQGGKIHERRNLSQSLTAFARVLSMLSPSSSTEDTKMAKIALQGLFPRGSFHLQLL